MDKVLHVLPMNKMSGAEKMALLICKNLNKFEPVVVCGGKELAETFEKEGIKSYYTNFSNKKLLTSLNKMKKIVKENNIKVIHAHDNTASINAYMAKKLFNLDLKVISHVHSCYPWLESNGINKKIDYIVRNKYDLNIMCGKVVSDFYLKNAKYINQEKIESLSNSIDIKEILQVNDELIESCKKEYKIPTDKFIIGFIGRIEKVKGLIPFIKALNKYKHEFNECKFVIVGNGSIEKELKDLILKQGMQDLFILTGFQNNTYKFYPNIDILILPSLYEGLPMVILEAMAFKKPVVSTNVGSIYEVINDGENGYLIDKNNLDKFIEKIIDLKNKKNYRLDMGNKAQKAIFKNYNIENYIESINNMYSAVGEK